MNCNCGEFVSCNKCIKIKFISSGNKVVDDFIRYTQTNGSCWKMEFVPYNNFKDVEFFAEGGFSKIYKAFWIDGPISIGRNNNQDHRTCNKTVALKELNNSKNLNSKELNEVF